MAPTAGKRDGARRREAPDVRRDQILDAAEQVLLTSGLHATTVADVAEAAGIAKGTVYLHFASKTELLSALRARHVEHFTQRLSAALTTPGRAKPSARLDRFVDEFFDYALAHRELHHVLFHEAGFSEDDAFADVKGVLRDFVDAGIRSGDFARGDAQVVTDFLISGIHGALVTSLHAGDTDVDKYVSGAKQLSRRVVAPTT